MRSTGCIAIINDIIAELDPAPGDALRDLAAIDDLRLFVSTTPDRLLAQAMNEVRFQGRPVTRELVVFPESVHERTVAKCATGCGNPTPSFSICLVKPPPLPQYAIHEEDRLEWLHALLSDRASLPDWLCQSAEASPMLFIGCEIPDWLGRFLLRMSSNLRLSLERDSSSSSLVNSASHEPSLSKFFATYCRKTLVQQLDMEPAAFVAELRARWEQTD